MGKSLRFNSNLYYQDLLEELSKSFDKQLEHYYREVESGLRNHAKSDVEFERLDSIEKGLMLGRVIGGPLAIMDSFGTGEHMDTSNPAVAEYLNSKYFNPLRPKVAGAPIVGRPEGYYINIFGERVYSSGRLAGVPLEGFLDSPIESVVPSGAFQNAEKWLKAENRLENSLKETVAKFVVDGSKNAGKYFSFG